MKRSPVSPLLFEGVLKFCRESTPSKMASEQVLVDIVKQFYLQFFKNEVGREITAIDAIAREQSVNVRIKLNNQIWEPLLIWFEQLCERFRDLQALSYVPSDETSHWFLVDYLPEFLVRALTWAKQTQRKGLTKSVQRARAAYERLIP